MFLLIAKNINLKIKIAWFHGLTIKIEHLGNYV